MTGAFSLVLFHFCVFRGHMDAVALLQELIAVPSVNPDHTTADDPLAGEARLAGDLARRFKELGATEVCFAALFFLQWL